MIGEKIKELRIKQGMTQKDLADRLFVSSQAVSRWENEEVEPSIGTIKQMSSIFRVSVDYLLGNEVEQPKPEPEVVTEYVYKEAPKPVLSLCNHCNKPIFEQCEIHRYEYNVHEGRSWHKESKILCDDCYKKQLEQDEREKAKKEKERRTAIKKKRNKGFVVSFLVFALFIIIGITSLVQGKTDEGIGGIALAILGSTFVGALIMDNTFISDMFLSVSRWGIRLPGVIFTLDLEGLFFLIAVKILFAVISFLVTAAAILFAIILGCFLGIFAYPVALYRSFRYID